MTEQAPPIAGPHLVRYGTAADQKYLLGDFAKTYDQLVVNANMVAHMPAALASFLTRRAKKPYFIDPQTHAFQHDLSHLESTSKNRSGEIKRSIRELVSWYGEPIASSVTGDVPRPLLPQDLKPAKVRSQFCERVVAFQLDRIKEEITKSDSAKYYDFLTNRGGSLPIVFGPSLVVAPYFYMTENTFEQWIDINTGCASISKEIAMEKSIPLAVQVVVSRGFLSNRNLRNMLIKKYAVVKPDLFLVWIDSFSEQKASENELSALVDLFRGLGQSALVVNLYGGFFSVALMTTNTVPRLQGVTHGLEYGEDRGVVPVGGGIPVAKYYLPQLNSRLLFRDALRAIRRLGGNNNPQEFWDKVCDCKNCRRVIKRKPETDFQAYGKTRTVSYKRQNQLVSRDFPIPETRDHSVRHYMWCKEREYKISQTADEVCLALDRTRDLLQPVLGLDVVAHCDVWKGVLSRINSG